MTQASSSGDPLYALMIGGLGIEINAVEPRDQSGINGLQEEDAQATGKHNIWTKVNPDCCFDAALPGSVADASVYSVLIYHDFMFLIMMNMLLSAFLYFQVFDNDVVFTFYLCCHIYTFSYFG